MVLQPLYPLQLWSWPLCDIIISHSSSSEGLMNSLFKWYGYITSHVYTFFFQIFTLCLAEDTRFSEIRSSLANIQLVSLGVTLLNYSFMALFSLYFKFYPLGACMLSISSFKKLVHTITLLSMLYAVLYNCDDNFILTKNSDYFAWCLGELLC